MLGGYSENMDTKIEYHIGYHHRCVLDITKCGVWGDILTIGFQSYESETMIIQI
jgi:hypothetical protein